MPSTWCPRSLSNMECSRCLSTELAPVARGRREGAQWRNTSPPPLNNKSPTDPTRNNNTSHAALAERKGAPQHPSRPSENPSQVPTRSGPKLQPNIPGRSMSTAWPRARDRDAKALSLTQNPIVAVASPRRGSRGARPTHTTRQPLRLSSPPKPWCIPSRHGAAPSKAGLRARCRTSRAAPAIRTNTPPLRPRTGAHMRRGDMWAARWVQAGASICREPHLCVLKALGRGRATMCSKVAECSAQV